MEESIRRAENLVRATNSTLAQMKFSLTFGNAEREISRKISQHSGTEKKKFDFDEEELEKIEKEFRWEANEMLSKMDKLLDSNQFPPKRIQAFSARDRIREINRKLFGRRGEQSKQPETDESRMKLLSLIDGDEEFKESFVAPIKSANPRKTFESVREIISREGTSSRRGGGGVGGQRLETKTNSDDREKVHPVAETSKEELKSKLLETQEIVERGFQTARELTFRIENMARGDGKKVERSPNSVRTPGSNEWEPRGLNRRCGKSESVETIKSSTSSKCARCIRSREKKKQEEEKQKEKEERQKEKEKEERQKEKEEKKKEKDEKKKEKEEKKKKIETEDKSKGKQEEIKEERNCLFKLRRVEPRKSESIPKLNHYRLPSIHIKGGLQMQRIHSLEIRPEDSRTGNRRANTAVKILSHEEIEKEKEKKLLEEIEKENCFCRGNEEGSNRIECFNCGKLIRVRRHRTNPKEIDNLLLKCRFDVFDPRIDEFVGKYARVGNPIGFEEENKPKEKIESVEGRIIDEGIREERKMEVNRLKDAKVRGSRTLKIEELSRKLSRGYREEADQLEYNHQEFETILKSLFKKIDDSREFFSECRLFSSLTKEKEEGASKKRQNLTATKPLIVSLTENSQTVKEMNLSDSNLNPMDEAIEIGNPFRRREKKKKLDKKDVKNKCKSRTWESCRKFDLFPLLEMDEKWKKKTEAKSQAEVPAEIVEMIPKKKDCDGSNPRKDIEKGKSSVMDRRESSSASTDSIRDESVHGAQLNSEMETKTENDYESDFEMESTKNDDGGNEGKDVEDWEGSVEGDEFAFADSVKKLSMITEVESESDRKLGEEEKRANPPAEKPFEAEEGAETSKRERRIEEGMKEVWNRAFEEGIAFTLKRQTNFLEEMEAAKPEMESHARKADEVFRRNVESIEANKNASPKSQNDQSKSQKSSSTEVVASLKDVLAALKDQFDRTQTLADKLTENVKDLKIGMEGSKKVEHSKTVLISSRKTGNSKLVSDPIEDLRKLRKDLAVGDVASSICRRESPSWASFRHWSNPGSPEEIGGSEFSDGPTANLKSSRADDHFEGGSDGEPSIGEVKLGSDRKRRKEREKSESSSNSEGGFGSQKKSSRVSSEKRERFKMADHLARISKSDEGSYSEGEIPSNIILKEEQCSSVQSIGEVISESISETSHGDV